MAFTYRYSVAKTARSYDPDGVMAVKGSVVYSETHDMRDAYHYGDGTVPGDVSAGPAEDTVLNGGPYKQLLPV
jgi:hypothetical protein